MPVFVDLDKPLVSQVLVNGELQRVEYEALPTICFSCGKYGHPKKLCSSPATDKGNETGKISGFLEREGDTEKEILGSIFSALKELENLELRTDDRFEMISVVKGVSKTDGGIGILDVGSRYAVVVGKSKEHSCKNKVGEGPCPLTNGASRKPKLGEVRSTGFNGHGLDSNDGTDLGFRSVGQLDATELAVADLGDNKHL
ncbi:hypothetical protein PVK06_046596 [Gossypium arboreum]|uniref:CCHC-type domain-containing protein n=1 Tax=Gossypium arboreum TaxID=29729 RepID=A0ABR0MAY3_GOSAR|nr:hypothetical protein PVK06_046596 [Gossypium arboreum]